MGNFIQVTTTTETKDNALKIARLLVERRLAACVQVIGPILSTYRWNGKTEDAEEWQCLIKSRADLFSALEQAVREIHPYEVPEIIATEIVAGCNDYLKWLDEETMIS